MQDYVREIAICLVLGGNSLRHSLEGPQGRRLMQLTDELCYTCIGRARVASEAHRKFLTHPVMPFSLSQKEPDWLEIGVNLERYTIVLASSILHVCSTRDEPSLRFLACMLAACERQQMNLPNTARM